MKTAVTFPVPRVHPIILAHQPLSRLSTRQEVLCLGFSLLLFGGIMALASANGFGKAWLVMPSSKTPMPCLLVSKPAPENPIADTAQAMEETALDIDLDIDSDNDGQIRPDDEAEDQLEADAYPGKIMTINDGDSDHNGFPDYADCSAGRPTGSPTSLVPIRLKMTLPPGKTWDTCQLYIQYPAIAENLRQLLPDGSIAVLEPGTDTEPGVTYLPPEETWWGPWYDETSLRLRLWTKDGKFIAPGRYYSAAIEDDPTLTFEYLGIAGNSATVEFWVEGCKSAADFQYMYIGLCEWESDTYVTDTVNVTINEPDKIDLDVDSDNNGPIDGNDAEDDIEDRAGEPGKIIPLGDNADVDNDGIPDFADGFDLEPETRKDSPAAKLAKRLDNQSPHAMILITLRLPDDTDFENAILQINYDASNPADVGVRIDRKDKKIYTLPPETVVADPNDPTQKTVMRKTLRLWREKSDGQGKPLGLVSRNKASVLDDVNGSYVPPGNYGKDKLACLGFRKDIPDGNIVTLWLEGVRASLVPGDCRISIYLDPDGDGPLPEKAFEDAVRITVMPTGIVPDWNRDGIINADDKGNVTTTMPWRIWKNDDQDKTAEANGILKNDGVDLPVAKGGDCTDLVVNGIRDLVDFFPFFLDVDTLRKIYPPEEFQYRLSYPGTLHAFCGNAGSGLSAANVGDLHKNIDIAEALKTQALDTVNPAGLLLDPDFLAQSGPVVFIEGVEFGDGGLELAIIKDGTTVFATRLPLQVCDVQQMFFRKDLCWAACNEIGTGDCARPTRPPFFTDQDHWLVMVHGYDVNAEDARMCFAETYKRFFLSGSNARYCGVNWNGRPPTSTMGPTHYHQAVVNAFATAPFLADFINDLPGTRTVIGHSLGNMVVGEAICLRQNPANITNYIALDAAVAKEAWGDVVMPEDLVGAGLNDKGFFIELRGWPYNVKLDPLNTWSEYVAAGAGQLLSSEWYRLFDAGDRRSQLTWRNRFKNLPVRTNAFNFYSSTENVVGNLSDDSLTSDEGLEASSLYAWHKQEKLKGRRYAYNLIPGIQWENIGGGMSDFCGWCPSPFYRQFKDETLNRFSLALSIEHNTISIISLLSGTIEELTAAKQRFQALGLVQTPIDIVMLTLGTINSILRDTWSFTTSTASDARQKINVLKIEFKNPQSLLKAATPPLGSRVMADVKKMADSMSKKQNQKVTVEDLLRVQPYFAVDSGVYLKSLNRFKKPRFQNLTETVKGVTPGDFLAKRASTIEDITEYYDKNPVALRRVSVKDWLLAEAFPATTNAVGANPIGLEGFPKKNIDMSKPYIDNGCMTDYSRWPRRYKGAQVWYHSDYKNAPFVHVYKFYEKVADIVKCTGGNL